MRLTKTEGKLLEHARTRGGIWAVASGIGRGPKDGRVDYGRREHDAVISMRDRGLVRIIESSRRPHTQRGRTVMEISVTFEVINKEGA